MSAPTPYERILYPDADCPASLADHVPAEDAMGMRWRGPLGWATQDKNIKSYIGPTGKWWVLVGQYTMTECAAETEARWWCAVAIAAAVGCPPHPADVGFVADPGGLWVHRRDGVKFVDLGATSVDEWDGMREMYVQHYPDTPLGRIDARLDAYRRAGITDRGDTRREA